MNNGITGMWRMATRLTGLALVVGSAFLSGCFPAANDYAESNERERPPSRSAADVRRLTTDERQAVHAIELVNAERAKVGLTPLARSRDLDAVAYRHALDLIRMNQLSHISSDGRRLENRLSHLRWTWAGENLARNKGFEDPSAEAVRGWLGSPRHRDNMFRPDFSHCGMAAIVDPATGFIYFVQVFLIPHY